MQMESKTKRAEARTTVILSHPFLRLCSQHKHLTSKGKQSRSLDETAERSRNLKISNHLPGRDTALTPQRAQEILGATDGTHGAMGPAECDRRLAGSQICSYPGFSLGREMPGRWGHHSPVGCKQPSMQYHPVGLRQRCHTSEAREG